MEEKNEFYKKGLHKVGDDFTSKLMQKIDKEEIALSNVLKEHGIVKTSPDFTTQLMTQLEGKRVRSTYTPVISKRTWIGIAAAFIGIVGLVTIYSTPVEQSSNYSKYVLGVMDTVSGFIQNFSSMYYVVVAVLLFSIGLLTEQKLGNRNS